MSEERKHIDHHFKTALGEEEEPLDLDLNWKAVQSGLDKYSFFKFQANRFNIYYLTALVTIVLLNLAVWLYIGVDSNVKELSAAAAKTGQSSIVLDTLDSESNSEVKSEEEKSSVSVTYPNKKKQSPAQQDLLPGDRMSPDLTIEEKKLSADTTPVIFNKVDTERRTDSLFKPKIKPPAVISRKRDTIIKVDTVFVKKRKKNK